MRVRHFAAVCASAAVLAGALVMSGCREAVEAQGTATTAPAAQPETTAAAPAAAQPPETAAAAPPAASDTPAAIADTPKSLTIEPPLGLPAVPIPADNPITAEKVELGKKLYFDKRLSKDGTISCATCHDPQMAWAEHTPTSTGIGKQTGGRNSPTVINTAYAKSLFWDGRAKTLEDQALGPIANPIEMGHEVEAMISDLSKIQAYKDDFQKVFGSEITSDNVAKAIAAFERTVLSGNSPYDKFQNGDESALTEAQQRGMALFEERCNVCHTAPLFSNYSFYNAGIGMDAENPDLGLMVETKKESDKGKFRVPPLRDIEKTYPYFHDGSVEKLEEAVAIMAAGGKDNPDLAFTFKALRDNPLNPEQQADVVEFLKALSGEYPVTEPPALP
ncbi:MAG: cytochrome-c peroxidase [Planctomycetota bacterium]